MACIDVPSGHPIVFLAIVPPAALHLPTHRACGPPPAKPRPPSHPARAPGGPRPGTRKWAGCGLSRPQPVEKNLLWLPPHRVSGRVAGPVEKGGDRSERDEAGRPVGRIGMGVCRAGLLRHVEPVGHGAALLCVAVLP